MVGQEESGGWIQGLWGLGLEGGGVGGIQEMVIQGRWGLGVQEVGLGGGGVAGVQGWWGSKGQGF